MIFSIGAFVICPFAPRQRPGARTRLSEMSTAHGNNPITGATLAVSDIATGNNIKVSPPDGRIAIASLCSIDFLSRLDDEMDHDVNMDWLEAGSIFPLLVSSRAPLTSGATAQVFQVKHRAPFCLDLQKESSNFFIRVRLRLRVGSGLV
ncbi:hypothetical protein E4U55_007197 [Claviceps digitariae]|nr:hypothetical protein E4U55_007197 [Claviceps digitariae]